MDYRRNVDMLNHSKTLRFLSVVITGRSGLVAFDRFPFSDFDDALGDARDSRMTHAYTGQWAYASAQFPPILTLAAGVVWREGGGGEFRAWLHANMDQCEADDWRAHLDVAYTSCIHSPLSRLPARSLSTIRGRKILHSVKRSYRKTCSFFLSCFLSCFCTIDFSIWRDEDDEENDNQEQQLPRQDWVQGAVRVGGDDVRWVASAFTQFSNRTTIVTTRIGKLARLNLSQLAAFTSSAR